MPKNHFSKTFLSFPGLKIIPHLITLIRFGLCWPMILALQQQNFWRFVLWAALFFVLDKLDGVLAKLLGVQSTFGKFLDSFVDKATFLIVLLAAFFYNLLPLFLFFIILGINIIQLFLTGWAVFFLKRKKLPVTYLPVFAGGALILSLFLKEPFSYLSYLLVIILSINHLYYYGKEIFSEKILRMKKWFQEPLTKLKISLNKIPLFGKIPQYYFSKLERRKESYKPNVGICTIANLVTSGRIILIPLILYFYWSQEVLIWIVLLVIFVITDFLDGALARRFNQVSRFGKILDAATDKILYFAFLIVWLFQELLPFWLFAFLMIRILLILIMAGLIFFFTKKTLPIAFFSFLSVVSLLFFIYGQSNFWLGLTVLLTWQLIVNYWYQGIIILSKIRRNPLQS